MKLVGSNMLKHVLRDALRRVLKSTVIAGALLATMIVAVPAHGSTLCPTGAVDNNAADSDYIGNLNGCTLAGPGGSMVTLSGFTLTGTGVFSGTLMPVDSGNNVGFVFVPTTTGAYTLSYTATCDTCLIAGGLDSDNGGSTTGTNHPYSFTITPDAGSGPVNHGYIYAPSFAPEQSAINTASWAGTGAANKDMTLDVTFAPEPGSLILFGSGFLAVALTARRRRNT